MKKFYSYCFYFLFLAGCFSATAQNTPQGSANDVPVRFAAGNFITGNNVQKQNFEN